MKKRFEGLTEGQTETLIAICDLNRNSAAFMTLDEVARQRLLMRYGRASTSGYFGMYVSTTGKMLEELTRRGYVDQAEKPGTKPTVRPGRCPYKVTKKGKAKVKRERP